MPNPAAAAPTPASLIPVRVLPEDPLAPLGLHALAETDVVPQPAGEVMEHVSLGVKIASLAVVILPFAGVVAAMVLLWGVALNWVHLVLLAVGYAITGLGITVGYHRLYTHRSFETNPIVKAFFGIAGSMAAEGPILNWVAAHRKHHQHSDRPDDPHSPHQHGETIGEMIRGFMHAHFGWFIKSPLVDVQRYAPDLAADTLTRRISKLFFLWVALGLLLPGAIAFAVTGTWMGALLGVLWGGAVRMFFVHHVTWSVNSVCHIWGKQEFRSRDHSRNNLIFGILALGEGWHNNHHAFPTSARHGLRWWQFDISYLVIRGLELVGLVRAVRVPTLERMEAGRLH
jgi:stearoyl-CoA desaturase (Delta-9 desaturase)